MNAKLLRFVLTANLCLFTTGIAGEIEADYQLALRYSRQADWNNADSILDRLLQQSPQYMPAVLLKARVLFSRSRYAESLRMTQRFIEHQPDNGEAHKLAGLAHFMTGNQDKAREELEKATRLSPSDAESFYYLGRIHFTASNLPRALSAFDTAITIDPRSVRAHNHRGQTLEGMARFDEAKAAYVTAIKLEREQATRSEWPYHNLGSLLLQQGETEEAVRYFREALARNPKFVPGKVKLAMALSLSNRVDEARTVLEEAVALEPRSSEAHYQLARLLTRMGRQEEAHKHFIAFQELQAR